MALPVHVAAEENDVEELGRLLDEDPGLLEAWEDDTPNYVFGSPIHYAVEAGSVDAARLLLDRGADVNKEDSEGRTPLGQACFYGRLGAVQLLLDRGAHTLPREPEDETVLMEASRGGVRPGSDHVAVIRLLIKDGHGQVDAHDSLGCTALYKACELGRTERARVLLVEGLADHTIAAYGGWLTPMAMAQHRGQEGCIRLLEWYEGELHRAFLVGKARAVLDATHSITKAPDKAQAQTQAEAQRAREEAAPAWLRGRVLGGEALPEVQVAGQEEEDEEERKREEELCAVCQWLVGVVSEDLHLELMEGLRYRRWLPGEA